MLFRLHIPVHMTERMKLSQGYFSTSMPVESWGRVEYSDCISPFFHIVNLDLPNHLGIHRLDILPQANP